LLQVGNEDWDLRKNINWTEIVKNNEDDDMELNGPRTEALRHDMNFYQVKSVKIIKPDEGDNKNKTIPSLPRQQQPPPPPSTQTQASPKANSSEIKLSVFENDKDKPRNKVYSQVI
jgi:hypothetical protein